LSFKVSLSAKSRSAWEEFELLVSKTKDRGVSFTSTLPTVVGRPTKNSYSNLEKNG